MNMNNILIEQLEDIAKYSSRSPKKYAISTNTALLLEEKFKDLNIELNSKTVDHKYLFGTFNQIEFYIDTNLQHGDEIIYPIE